MLEGADFSDSSGDLDKVLEELATYVLLWVERELGGAVDELYPYCISVFGR